MDQPPAVAFTSFADAWPMAIETEIGATLCAIGCGKDLIYSLPMLIHYLNHTQNPKCTPWDYIRGGLIFGRIFELVYRGLIFREGLIFGILRYTFCACTFVSLSSNHNQPCLIFVLHFPPHSQSYLFFRPVQLFHSFLKSLLVCCFFFSFVLCSL